jgi:hypothetical protein
VGAIRPLRCSVEPADRPRNACTFTARLSAVTSRFRLGDQPSNSLPKRVDHARGIRHRLTMTDRPGNAAIPLARTGRRAVRAFGCLRSTKTEDGNLDHLATREAENRPGPAVVMSRAPGRKHVAALVCAASGALRPRRTARLHFRGFRPPLAALSRALLRRQKCSFVKRKRGPACAAGSGGMEQPDRPSEGTVKLPGLRWRGPARCEMDVVNGAETWVSRRRVHAEPSSRLPCGTTSAGRVG